MKSNQIIPDSWDEVFKLAHPIVFGILNVTPDSFSDGRSYSEPNDIELRFNDLANQGAHVIDVGAESTRPGAKQINADQQIQRLENVFELAKLKSHAFPLLSIDTRDHAVANRAIENGFQIINDVSGAKFDEAMAETMAKTCALVVLMHSRGTPETMQEMCHYENVIEEVCQELETQIETLVIAGVKREKIMVDPGIGFAKTPTQSLELIENISEFKKRIGLPVLVGLSRKTVVSFVMSGDPKSVPFAQRDAVSAQMSESLLAQGADAIRVHNVALIKQL